MGTARDSLQDRQKDRGLEAQQRAIEELQRCIAENDARKALQDLQSMLENLQMAPNGQMQNDGDDEMAEMMDQLGDMIRQQQELRDKTFEQGQDQRRQRGQQGQRGQQNQQGQLSQQGQQGQQSMADLQQRQQALRDQLKKLLEEMRKRGMGQEQGQGQQGQGQQGQQGQQQGQGDGLGQAEGAMEDAQGQLGQGNADGAVDSQGRALDALRRGQQSMAQAMQQQQGPGGRPGGPGRPGGRFGQARAQQDTDPLGRPLRGRDYGDDSTVKVPGEIDAQRARRILEELRRRYGEISRPQLELDYIERLLKDY
jgi:uncharacterized protein (TIGR02302 family)